jgi:hypothetical protein
VAECLTVSEAVIDWILKVWELSDNTVLNAGASDQSIAVLEKILHGSLPGDMRACYLRTDGADVLGGNIALYPIHGAKFSVSELSEFYRDSEWPVPEDLVVFGGDGCGDPFGIWAPPGGGSTPLIVKVGAIFELGCMAVVGTSFSRFLLGRTAYYLLLDDTDPSCLDLLGVPQSLRTSDPDDATYEAIVRWADPELPGLSIDPYTARLTEDDIRQMASSAS